MFAATLALPACSAMLGGPPATGDSLALTARLGLEQRTRGGFRDYRPTEPVPVPWAPGDRAWLQVEAPPEAHVYVLGARGHEAFDVLATSAPGSAAVRQVWPEGRIVDAALTAWDTVLVVAARGPLDWAVRADCPGRMGTQPVAAPSTPCDHLYGLFWVVPPAPRGLVAPDVGRLERPSGRLSAIEARDAGESLAAVLFHVRAGE